MAQDATKKCFLDLAFETRIDIHKLAFGNAMALIEGHDMTDSSDDYDAFHVVKYHPRSGQLLRTCQSVCEEALPVLYESMLVVFDRCSDPILCFDWEHSNLPSTSQIRHLELQLGRNAYRKIGGHKNMLKSIAKWNFRSLKSLTLACFFPEWVNAEYKNDSKRLIKYKDAHQKLGEIAWAFLSETGINCVQDKSVYRVSVEYHLSTIHTSRLPKDVSQREYPKYYKLTVARRKPLLRLEASSGLWVSPMTMGPICR